ncbi:MAG: host attachment protein [Hyphomicrobiaceae bacterium]|nr:host attachment protein [Hyphomicrobiaceae bacterium]MCC0024917.1 host attachment protein [Hyphomicrobiaceae bacterium]
MKSTKTWILLADGNRARIVEFDGPANGLREDAGLQFAQVPMKAGEMQTDRPGRSFASAGYGRAAMAPHTDPVEKREADFTANLAATLDEKLRQNAFDRLIIAAAPKALGNLRKALSARVNEVVYAEIAKDLLNVPSDKLATHFEDVLAV